MVKKLSWTMVKKLRMKISFVLSGSAKRSEKFGFFGSALSSFADKNLSNFLVKRMKVDKTCGGRHR